ncbi:hypothetical protein K8O93_00775 [Gordonia bronchialis]|uniref:hypothetical protein n=1 Tax=Gordonia bronchialis TaxID=2054 RepID=UPI001CBD1335|nr:hypothetical protein [Gordonia bronchialis]UAK38367.1 hypothetical protein K8O93_00775 [Gordonia bronchialis]
MSELFFTDPTAPDRMTNVTKHWDSAAPAQRDKPTGPVAIPEPPRGTVLTFSKTFPQTPGKAFLYCALKVRKDEWYITGRVHDSMTWIELLEFIGDGQRDGLGWRTIRVATGWAGGEE